MQADRRLSWIEYNAGKGRKRRPGYPVLTESVRDQRLNQLVKPQLSKPVPVLLSGLTTWGSQNQRPVTCAACVPIDTCAELCVVRGHDVGAVARAAHNALFARLKLLLKSGMDLLSKTS